MGQNWKPIDRVREYGNQTDFVETSEFPNEPIKHFIHNCNLTTCRYNENGKCTNEEKRKACAEEIKKVLIYQNKQGEIPIWASNMIGNIESLKKFGIEIDLSKFETQGVVLIKRS